MTLSNKRQAVFAAAIFLTASLSFGAGYLVRQSFSHAPIIIEKCSGV